MIVAFINIERVKAQQALTQSLPQTVFNFVSGTNYTVEGYQYDSYNNSWYFILGYAKYNYNKKYVYCLHTPKIIVPKKSTNAVELLSVFPDTAYLLDDNRILTFYGNYPNHSLKVISI